MKGKIFNAQEVQAIIEGNKTMFREVCQVQPSFIVDEEKLNITHGSDYFKPKFKVGQEISVKHQESLITLKIKSVKVERLEDISEEDARLEGFPVDHLGNYYEPSKLDPWQGYARASFSLSWDPTHKKPEEKWEANPWVFVYEFEVLDLKK